MELNDDTSCHAAVLKLFKITEDIVYFNSLIDSNGELIIIEKKFLAPFLNDLEKIYSTDINNFKTNLNSYDVDTLLDSYIIFSKCILNIEYLNILLDILLKKMYENDQYKKILFTCLYNNDYYAKKIFDAIDDDKDNGNETALLYYKDYYANIFDPIDRKCNNKDNNHQGAFFHVDQHIFKETWNVNVGLSDVRHEGFWTLNITKLTSYLNEKKYSVEISTSQSENIQTFIGLFKQQYIQKKNCLRTVHDHKIDFSYLDFLNPLFNYEKKFYVLNKLLACADCDQNGWNTRMEIATIFIAVLYSSRFAPAWYTSAGPRKVEQVFNKNRIKSFERKKFDLVQEISFNHSDLTSLNVRFWTNLFPYLQTISVVGCKLKEGLSPSDKLFLAGYNVYGYSNRASNFKIIIDSEQVSLFKITWKEYFLMFIQDCFGGLSSRQKKK